MSPLETFEAARELVGMLLTGLAEIRKGDERQEFLDRTAREFFPVNRSPSIAYEQAQRLWEERERRRGQPSERELAVRWLLRQAQGQPPEKGSSYSAAADAIKAGRHLETPDPEADTERGPGG